MLACAAVPGPVEETLPKDFGKYRLERKIATGGMAEIFLARLASGDDRPLVIKRILPHLIENTEFVSMFLDEARIAARLRHPHVVEIFDIGQIQGSYFIAMEYVHGEDIRRIYNQAFKLQRSLPLSHSIRVVAEAALGLGYAHKLTDELTKRPLGVVHRDVSPQNIIITYEGRAKVVDFGIARAANKVNQTRAGVLKGKYSYMSPEQAIGDDVDHRTDVFALGIILYETTTGTRLFKRHNELATLQAVIKCEFTPPSKALRGYPAALQAIVERALAKDRRDRYQDAEDLSKELFVFLEKSGLYVEPAVVADFMADLFEARLTEEKTTGAPVFPAAEELGREMEATGTLSVATGDAQEEIGFADTVHRDRSGEMTPLPAARSDTLLEDEDTALPPASAPGFADGFDDSELGGGTVAEPSPQVSVTTRDEPRPHPSAGGSVPKVEHVPLPPDLQPTVALQEAYGDAKAAPSSAPRLPVAAPSPAPSPKREVPQVEPARVRPQNGASPKAGPVRGGAARPSINPGPVVSAESLPTWPYLLLLASIVVLLGLAAFYYSRAPGRAPAPPPSEETVARAAEGEVLVLTEPGAQVYLGEDKLGTADPEGRAGPFSVTAGPQLLRVVHVGRRFERTREVVIGPQRVHELEIRARQGWLKLVVVPWAHVSVDGKAIGMTPLSDVVLDEGQHELVLENPEAGLRYDAAVPIAAGERVELKIDLAAVGAKL